MIDAETLRFFVDAYEHAPTTYLFSLFLFAGSSVHNDQNEFAGRFVSLILVSFLTWMVPLSHKVLNQ